MKRSGTLTSIITVVGAMDMWLGLAIPASMTESQATAATAAQAQVQVALRPLREASRMI